jgi:phage protein D
VRAALNAAGPEIWSGVPLLTEVQIGLDGQWLSLITGNADTVSIDPIRGEIHTNGRDLAALFVDTQIDESFENQTSSDIATLLANRQGLMAAVTPTQTLTGRYYQSGRTRTALTQHARATTQWDLLCWLAQLEGFDVWMTGRTLNFAPAPPAVPVVTITPQDCTSLRMHHALDIAAGATVVVKSWDAVSQAAVMQSSSTNPGSSLSTTRTVVRPNLSSTDAQLLADQLLSQISGHERSIDIEMPGDLVMFPRMVVQLAGTSTDFDGVYSICSVDRRISFHHGFTQTIEARSVPWTAS